MLRHLLRSRTLVAGAVLFSTIASAPTSQAAFCWDAWKPQLNLKVVTKSDGKAYFQPWENKGLPAKVMNQLVAWLHSPLEWNEIAKVIGNLLDRDAAGQPIRFGDAIDALGGQLEYDPEVLGRIPRTGPLIVFANHPLAGMDSLSISSIIEKVRPDVKIVAHKKIAQFLPGVSKLTVLVDEFDRSRDGVKAMFDALDGQLAQGGALVIFPAARISGQDPVHPDRVVDRPWGNGIVQLVRHNPTVQLLPVYFEGKPSDKFLKVQKKSDERSQLLIPAEITKASKNPVKIHLGAVIPAQEVLGRPRAQQLPFLRDQVYQLAPTP